MSWLIMEHEMVEKRGVGHVTFFENLPFPKASPPKLPSSSIIYLFTVKFLHLSLHSNSFLTWVPQ